MHSGKNREREAETCVIEQLSPLYNLLDSFSKKDGGFIVVLGLSYGAPLAVLDCDTPAMAPRDALGYSITPHGRHYYVMGASPSGKESRWQDPSYAAISKENGRWAERLFSKDGTPRPVPVCINPTGFPEGPLEDMKQHVLNFKSAQKKAMELGLTKPRKDAYNPPKLPVVTKAKP